MTRGPGRVVKPTKARGSRAAVAERLAPGHVRTLLAAARRVRGNAHAPYSRFLVGAAVLDEQGRIHVGCNVENASYGLTICAERNAVAAAIGAGARRVTAVAIVTSATPPTPPCGACRQVLAEVAGDSTPVLMATTRTQTPEVWKLGDLLPRAFRL